MLVISRLSPRSRLRRVLLRRAFLSGWASFDRRDYAGLGDTFGEWSPDAHRIVFQRYQDIYSIGVDGSNLVQITSDGHSGYPAWSPDGTKIAFDSSRTGHGEINVINVDGSGQTQLTNTIGGVILPDWQPIPGPQRSDYKNAAHFCKADRDFLGDEAFGTKYGANAFGKCVSQSH